MSVTVATTLDEALAVLAAAPGATIVAGGTDLMVELNMHHRPVADVLVVDRVPELCSWRVADGRLEIGAGVTWSEIEGFGSLSPALAEAARTVGSPQIRHAGTIGGNLGTCSPAGDGLPVLAVLDAVVTLVAGDGGRREVPFADFMVGPKRSVRRADELILSVSVPVASGWQGYAKVGVRNAMVIATASAALAVQPGTERPVRLALGSVGPTILRCTEAEDLAAASVDLDRGRVDAEVVARFAELARAAARPIDDHRSTADYRRHAVGVLAGRLLRRAFPGG